MRRVGIAGVAAALSLSTAGARAQGEAAPAGALAPQGESGPAPAAAMGAPEILGLADCVGLARRNYPKVAEGRARLTRVREQLREARYAPFSAFEGRFGVSTPPRLEGTSVYSPDRDDTLDDDFRVGMRAGVSGVLPLWTFGKITSLWNAAEAQEHYTEHELEKLRNEAEVAVREAFYGLQFARDGLALVEDAIERLERYEQQLAERVGEGDADEADLYRLRLQLADLSARRSEAQSQAAIARAGLAFLIGRERAGFDIPPNALAPVVGKLAPLSAYQDAATGGRPELAMAKWGLKGRRAQVDQQEAAFYPDLGLGLSFDWSYAPGITDQQNPFVRDQANYRRYGVGVGLRWKLDFLPQLARLEQARAQLAEVEATSRYARGGVEVEVEKAYRQAEHADRRLHLYEDAVKLARRWLVETQQGVEIGVFEAKDLADPAKEYALKRFSHMTAIFDFNIAVARLALATGRPIQANREPQQP